MTNETRHRIWAFAALSWLVIIVLPTTVAAIQWQLGIGRDPDMSGVLELIIFLVVVSSVPAALVAFGLLAPLAIAVDRATCGAEILRAGEDHGGLVLFRRTVRSTDYGHQARLRTDLWADGAHSWDWLNRIVYLPKSPLTRRV